MASKQQSASQAGPAQKKKKEEPPSSSESDSETEWQCAEGAYEDLPEAEREELEELLHMLRHRLAYLNTADRRTRIKDIKSLAYRRKI
jgi:hypothetical protein